MSPLFRTLPSSVSRASPSGSVRALHILPPFANLKLDKPVLGMRKNANKKSSPQVFLPPAVLKRLTKEYHQGLLDRLNEQVRGTKLESLKIVETITKTSNEPDQVLAFNYASSALNNAFFLTGLRQAGSSQLDRDFLLCLIKSFGSLQLFEQAATATINGMVSSGWLWLVKVHGPDGRPGDARIEFRVSYAAGTIVTPSRQQSGVSSGLPFVPPAAELEKRDGLRSNPQKLKAKGGRGWSADADEDDGGVPTARVYSGPASTEPSGSMSTRSRLVTPLACLSLHERAYLDHHGHSGRTEFFRQWLHALDYARIHERINASGPMIDLSMSEDVIIERWQASLDAAPAGDIEATNSALERAFTADEELIAKGQDPLYNMPRNIDRYAGVLVDHTYLCNWAHGRPTGYEAEPAEDDAPAAAAAEEATDATPAKAVEDESAASAATASDPAKASTSSDATATEEPGPSSLSDTPEPSDPTPNHTSAPEASTTSEPTTTASSDASSTTEPTPATESAPAEESAPVAPTATAEGATTTAADAAAPPAEEGKEDGSRA